MHCQPGGRIQLQGKGGRGRDRLPQPAAAGAALASACSCCVFQTCNMQWPIMPCKPGTKEVAIMHCQLTFGLGACQQQQGGERGNSNHRRPAGSRPHHSFDVTVWPQLPASRCSTANKLLDTDGRGSLEQTRLRAHPALDPQRCRQTGCPSACPKLLLTQCKDCKPSTTAAS